MPPVRTMPPAKALKTERTHEENQERAYIAASRRSDRSLEARVESARRASEIHKRRTGRSLRVSEQDVVNEEMYEEEDDDLPVQYRRLTAHLQTGSTDFNRRLSAYLTNHVAMRSALDQAISNSYAQQYPNAPQFSHNQSVYPSPFPQKSPRAQWPQSYAQPYPTPGTPGYRPSYQQQHQRRPSQQPQPQRTSSFSPHSPHPSVVQPNAPPNAPVIQRQASQSSHSTSHSPVQPRTSVPQTPRSHKNSPVAQAGQTSVPPPMVSGPPPPQKQVAPHGNEYSNMSPFSMALPVESQMLLNGVLDPNDPMTSALMAGYENLPHTFHQDSQSEMKPHSFNPHIGGINTTLAPSALDMQSRQVGFNQNAETNSMPPTFMAQQSFDNADFSKLQMFPPTQSSQGSGTGTPGLDAGWEAFINDTSWTETGT